MTDEPRKPGFEGVDKAFLDLPPEFEVTTAFLAWVLTLEHDDDPDVLPAFAAQTVRALAMLEYRVLKLEGKPVPPM